MTVWLHWIGAVHYSIESFIAEAEKMGVSRRITALNLRKMEWGDKVYCVLRGKGEFHPVVFGYFFVETIYGIQTKDLIPEIVNKVYYVADPLDLQDEKRGCGDLQPGGLYATTTATVEELADASEEPQVRGGLKVLPKPWPVIVGMPPFRGFRPFDEERFLADCSESKTRPRLRNMYYA